MDEQPTKSPIGTMQMTIRSMQAADVPFAASCTTAEGWDSETATEFKTHVAFRPAGGLIAEIDQEPVGICVATAYESAGFIGELIVTPRWRGRGIGRRLLEQAIEFLHKHSVGSIYLDGVPAAVPLYEKLGFRKVCPSLRFSGVLPAGDSTGARLMKAADLPGVLALDKTAFRADRNYFLKHRLDNYPDLALVLEDEQRLIGYLFGRRGRKGISLGPWCAPEASTPAEHLLHALTPTLAGREIGIGVLASNRPAATLLHQYGLTPHSSPPWRMVLGHDIGLGVAPQLLAIGSPAKG